MNCETVLGLQSLQRNCFGTTEPTESTEPVLVIFMQRSGRWNTCCAQGDEGLHMLADQVQLILRQRQPLHNVLNEVVRSDSSQVPLQFTKNHQFPFLKGDKDKDARKRNTYIKE